MAEIRKVSKTGVKRETGYLYFVDRDGDVSRAPMKKSGKKGGKQKVARAAVKKRSGFMYFIDRAGDVCEVKMSRDGAKKKSRSELAKPTVKYLVYEQMRKSGRDFRAKKVLLAANCRDCAICRPTVKSGQYGVEVKYEAKVGSKYTPTSKFVNIAKPANKIRLVNEVPQKYR